MSGLSTEQKLAVLRKARALVEAGWTQGTFYRFDGENPEYCATGAINKACFELLAPKGATLSSLHVRAMRLALHEGLPPSAQSKVAVSTHYGNHITAFDALVKYNDTERRRKSSVLRVFDRAIQKLEGN